MASITNLEKKTITKKNGAVKEILCVYLNGKATDKQKAYFNMQGFHYYPAQKDWAQIDGRWVKVGYKSSGSWYKDYDEKTYNELAKCVVRKAEPQPAPQPKAEPAQKKSKPTTKADKAKAIAEFLEKTMTSAQLDAYLAALNAK